MEKAKGAAIWVGAATAEDGEIMREVLLNAGFLNPLEIFRNELELAQRVETGPSTPVLIVLDLNFPEEKIWPMLAKIAAMDGLAKVPKIALVDARTEGLLDRAYENGVSTYLNKPFTFAQLLERARLLKLNFMIERPPCADRN